MCKNCNDKTELIETMVNSDVSNGKKVQKKLRKKLSKIGKSLQQIRQEFKMTEPIKG